MSEVAEDSLLGGSKNEAAVLPRMVLRVLLVCSMFLMHPTERDSVGTNATRDFWTGKTNC